MWLGRIDFRIAGGDTKEQDLRELAGAIVLHDLLHRLETRLASIEAKLEKS